MSVRDAVAVAVRTGPRTVRQKVREVSGRAALYAVLGAILFTVTVSRIAEEGLVQLTPEPPPMVPAGWGPPIRDCPDDVELWDCMRHAKYRRGEE